MRRASRPLNRFVPALRCEIIVLGCILLSHDALPDTPTHLLQIADCTLPVIGPHPHRLEYGGYVCWFWQLVVLFFDGLYH